MKGSMKDCIKTGFNKVALAVGMLAASGVLAHAEGDDITAAITTANGYFTAVKALAIVIVVFVIGKRLLTRFSK